MICELDRSAVDNIEIEQVAGTDDNAGLDVCGCAARHEASAASLAADTTAPEAQLTHKPAEPTPAHRRLPVTSIGR